MYFIQRQLVKIFTSNVLLIDWLQLKIKIWCLSVVYLDATPFFSGTINDTKGSKPVTFFDSRKIEEQIKNIPTPNLKASGMTRVCMKHFDDKDIKKSDIFKFRNGDPDIIVSIDRYCP